MSEATGVPPSKPWFEPEEQPALLDFWQIYDDNFDAVGEASRVALEAHPVFGPIMRATPKELMEEEGRRSRERMKAAVHGSWEEYDRNLRDQGTVYAQMGVEFSVWYDVLNLLSRHLVPRMVARFAAEPLRLSAALLAMQRFLDKAMAGIAEQYLATKQALVQQQKALAEERAAALAVSDERLRRQTAILTSVLETTQEGISVSDEHGMVVLFNKAAREMCGMDATGKPADGLVASIPAPHGGEDGAQDTEPLLLRALRGESPDDVAMWIERADGVRTFCSAYARPLRDGSGVVQGAMVNFRDVTERTRLEAERARSMQLELENRQIQHANRLKSEFLANMSHELRTPLNAIIGFAELIHDGEVTPEMPQYREFLGDILSSGRHLLQLINDVLDLAKVEAGKLEFHPEELDPRVVIGEILGILGRAAAARSIRLGTQVDAALDRVFVDSARLKQVLYNYVSNALKFTPEGLSLIHI